MGSSWYSKLYKRAARWTFGLSLALGAVALPVEAAESERVWVRHPVVKGEQWRDVAERYSVSVDEVRDWNESDEERLAKRPQGPFLWVELDRTQAPRQRRRVRLKERQSWEELAEVYEVSAEQLRRWNPYYAKVKGVPAGASLILWDTSGIEHVPTFGSALPLPEIEVPEGGVSVGRPQIGRLRGGVMLPPSEHYTIRFPEMAYGTTITIRGIRRALAGFRRDTGFSREITIGAISLAKGRKLPPHKSHQSGRDVDVRLPAMPHALETGPMRSDQVDWYATWALLEAFVRTGDVQVMFLEKRTHKHVRRAAMRLGASDEYIEQVFSFVTHQSGHGSHIHVRFRCSEQASSCRG